MKIVKRWYSIWLRTGYNSTDINRFLSPTGIGLLTHGTLCEIFWFSGILQDFSKSISHTEAFLSSCTNSRDDPIIWKRNIIVIYRLVFVDRCPQIVKLLIILTGLHVLLDKRTDYQMSYMLESYFYPVIIIIHILHPLSC